VPPQGPTSTSGGVFTFLHHHHEDFSTNTSSILFHLKDYGLMGKIENLALVFSSAKLRVFAWPAAVPNAVGSCLLTHAFDTSRALSFFRRRLD
jgi:hypothetical protein